MARTRTAAAQVHTISVFLCVVQVEHCTPSLNTVSVTARLISRDSYVFLS